MTVDLAVWDDPAVDWSDFDLVLLRSPWDYTDRLTEFLDWLERVDRATTLRNPLGPVRWSMDKHYLVELARAGVPIIPTAFVEVGERASLAHEAWVVKPVVGAGAQDVAIFRRGQEAAAHAHVLRIHQRGVAAMVQPLLRSVAVDGEWPMVFFGGHFSHCASKRVHLPNPDDPAPFFAPEQNAPWSATPEQVDAAQRCMDTIAERFGALTYARVDLVRDDNGKFVVLEVELAEPSLFLPEGGPAAVDNLVRAILEVSV